jgi:hypothetical protein
MLSWHSGKHDIYPTTAKKAYIHETPIMTTLITNGSCFGFLVLFSTERTYKIEHQTLLIEHCVKVQLISLQPLRYWENWLVYKLCEKSRDGKHAIRTSSIIKTSNQSDPRILVQAI